MGFDWINLVGWTRFGRIALGWVLLGGICLDG